MSDRPRPWRQWLLAAIAGAVLSGLAAGALALAVIYGGLFDATADTPHMSIVAWSTHNAFKSSVTARASQAAPPPELTPARLTQGALVYDRNCAACHGAPGVNRAPFAHAMIPTPPYLLDAARRWDPRQLTWIVDHGIKMTAMPAWGEVLPKDQVDDVVGFLRAMPRLSARGYAALRARAQGMAAAPPPPSAALEPPVQAAHGGAPSRAAPGPAAAG